MRSRRHFGIAVLGLAAIGLLLGGAAGTQAGPIVFAGADNGVGPGGPRPISDAAAAAFDLAAGTSPATAITFESAPLGNFTTLTVAPGVTATLAGQAAGGGIVTTPTFFGGFSPVTLGYNTTPGGANFVGVVPDAGGPGLTLTFAFAKPISAFGAYLTGTETGIQGTFTLEFNDGLSEILPIAKNAGGGVQFFGFVDPGASISSVTLHEAGPFTSTRDIIGVDDVRFAAAAPVPEPSTFALLALGGAALAGWRRWRKQRHAG